MVLRHTQGHGSDKRKITVMRGTINLVHEWRPLISPSGILAMAFKTVSLKGDLSHFCFRRKVWNHKGALLLGLIPDQGKPAHNQPNGQENNANNNCEAGFCHTRNHASESLTIPYAAETPCAALEFDHHLMLMRPSLFTLLFLVLVTVSSVPATTHTRGMHPDEKNEYRNPKPVIL
jgi:hypothetical protein